TRGTDQESQTKNAESKYTRRTNHTSSGTIGTGIPPTERVAKTGPLQPPRYRIAIRADAASIRSHLNAKTMPNRIPLYSVVQPTTSSASASGMSNGTRSISAIIETVKRSEEHTSELQSP